MVVRESRKLARNYVSSTEFKFDVLSILPTDFLYFAFSNNSMVRINRLLRLHRLGEFFNRTIRRTK